MRTLLGWLEGMAEVAGERPGTLRVTARDLGEADPPLFIRPGRGAKGLDLPTRAGVHVVLAAVLATSGRAAQAITRLYAPHQLYDGSGTVHASTGPVGVGPLVFHGNPLDTVVGIVQDLRGDGRGRLLPALEKDFQILFHHAGNRDFGLSTSLLVQFIFSVPGLENPHGGSFIYNYRALIKSEEDPITQYQTKPTYQISVPGRFLVALADALREGDSRHKDISPTSPPTLAVPDAGQRGNDTGLDAASSSESAVPDADSMGERASHGPESLPVPGGADGDDHPQRKLGVNGVPAPSTPDRLKPTARRRGSSERKHVCIDHGERESQSALWVWVDFHNQNDGIPHRDRSPQRAHDEREPCPAHPLRP